MNRKLLGSCLAVALNCELLAQVVRFALLVGMQNCSLDHADQRERNDSAVVLVPAASTGIRDGRRSRNPVKRKAVVMKSRSASPARTRVDDDEVGHRRSQSPVKRMRVDDDEVGHRRS